MMPRYPFLLAAFAALMGPACAAEPCLVLDDIHTWSVPDDRTVIVEDYEHNKFQVNLMGTCTGLRFNQSLAFKSVGGTGLSCLRAGDYLLRRQQPSRCTIANVEPLTVQGNSAANMNVH